MEEEYVVFGSSAAKIYFNVRFQCGTPDHSYDNDNLRLNFSSGTNIRDLYQQM